MKKLLSLFLIFNMLLISMPSYADLRTPAWYDVNAVSTAPDWHYRVPISIPAGASVNSTVEVNVDFAALLSQMDVVGTFDINSPRVVRANGTIVTIQEYTDTLYNGATDPINNNRGEIKFILQDAGAVTYYLYFDITQNGTKPANPQTPINGNFERGSTGTTNPLGWNAPVVVAGSGTEAQMRPAESPSVTMTDAVVGNMSNSPKTVNGNPNTGSFSYLIGARTNAEVGTNIPAVTITKTITVPASNPGNLTFSYKVAGWDSNKNGITDQYDYIAVDIVGSSTTNVVGPAANNYTTYPFAPNYGTQQAANNILFTPGRSGYAHYNAWDMQPDGTRRPQDGNAAMTLTRGQEPWFNVTQSLAAYAGQTITLRFSFANTVRYKSWAQIDDVEWSLVIGTLGTPQAFGVNITNPSPSSAYTLSQTLSILVQTDASVSSMLADLYNPSGVLVATGIRLYNNGTHGDATSNDSIWSNNGSVPADPTYTFPTNSLPGNYRLVVYGDDFSTSGLGATYNGLVSIPGQPNPMLQANFYNIDEQIFGVTGSTDITLIKSVAVLRDPINGTNLPKAIPGATMVYTINVYNNNLGSYDTSTLNLNDAIPLNTSLYVNDYAGAGTGPIQFANGSVSSTLTYTYTALNSTTDDVEFSNDNGVTFTYVPTPNALGVDPNVTTIRISPKGMFATKTGSVSPSFGISFRVLIK